MELFLSIFFFIYLLQSDEQLYVKENGKYTQLFFIICKNIL